MSDPELVDPEAFWLLGSLRPAGGAGPERPAPGCGLDTVGRPEITVDGRNLADVLRPAYTAVTAPVVD
ncbi:MAG TPA: hypothetical protein VI248_13205 [Kineosporiaceae bacterium]